MSRSEPDLDEHGRAPRLHHVPVEGRGKKEKEGSSFRVITKLSCKSGNVILNRERKRREEKQRDADRKVWTAVRIEDGEEHGTRCTRRKKKGKGKYSEFGNVRREWMLI